MSAAGAAPPAAALEPVAFIGLGALGAPMAARLLQAGHPLTVHNRSRERELPLAAAGARRAASVPEAVAGAAVLCLCLSDDRAVQAVLLEQALAALAPGALVIDFSTIAPATSRALASHLEIAGITYLDAPVTGGTEGARNGSLAVLGAAAGRRWSGHGRCWRRWGARSAISGPWAPASRPRR